MFHLCVLCVLDMFHSSRSCARTGDIISVVTHVFPSFNHHPFLPRIHFPPTDVSWAQCRAPFQALAMLVVANVLSEKSSASWVRCRPGLYATCFYHRVAMDLASLQWVPPVPAIDWRWHSGAWQTFPKYPLLWARWLCPDIAWNPCLILLDIQKALDFLPIAIIVTIRCNSVFTIIEDWDQGCRMGCGGFCLWKRTTYSLGFLFIERNASPGSSDETLPAPYHDIHRAFFLICSLISTNIYRMPIMGQVLFQVLGIR